MFRSRVAGFLLMNGVQVVRPDLIYIYKHSQRRTALLSGQVMFQNKVSIISAHQWPYLIDIIIT